MDGAFFFGFWANLALYGRLHKNEATGQVGGYGFGQVSTKYNFFREHTAQWHRLWYNVMVACASEQTRSVCTLEFPSPKRLNLPRHAQFFGEGDRVIKSVRFGVFQNLIQIWARSGPIWVSSGGVVSMWV